ncbi:MAG: sialidase family protein [Pyrinomonadaceae bacterium]
MLQPVHVRLICTAVRLKWLLIASTCSIVSATALLIGPLASARTANPEIVPTSGNVITDSSGPLTFTGGPYLIANPSSQVDGNPTCNEALPCDEYTFTTSVSSATSQSKYLKIEIGWPVVGEAQFDLYVFDGPTSSGRLIAKSLGDQTYVEPDVALIPAVAATNGVYTLRIVPFLPFGQSITGEVSLVEIPAAAPADPGVAAGFSNHISPANLGNNAGEPSIGVDWAPRVASLRNDIDKINTGGVAFFQSGANTLRVNFDDRTSPATATWEDKTAPTVKQFVLSDPIGFVDRQTGRVFSLDLIGGEGNSLAAFSDDDGNSWTPMQGGGDPAGPDHETIGGGPYNEAAFPPPPPHPTYQNAVYYCSQNIVGGAECSRSDDGGLTFGPGVDIFTPTQCYGGIHGHVKVGPDGTVYVPNSSCTSGNGGSQGAAISRDNGLTWIDSTVQTSTGSGDPSVGIDADNTVYIGYVNADGRPHVAVSSDHGQTWTRDWDVGVPVGCNPAADSNPAYAPCRIKSAVFPAVVAGDKNRAAFGFLGSTTGGNYQDQATFQGVWYFYVATTYDGGNSWTTVNATPDDPVQKGSICLGGLTCGDDRNLLDFNDISLDRQGRIIAAYADGCVAPPLGTCTAPDYIGRSEKAAIVRQASGRTLLAAFDPPPPPISIEDNDARIAYSAGWHLVNSGSASDGHFRYHTGNSSGHFASLDFNVPAGSTGAIRYVFARSPKGGSADLYVDGALKQTVSYAGSVGTTQAPEFNAAYQASIGNLAAGGHKLELRNLNGVVYLDRFVLESSSSSSQPASGPGSTSNQSGSAAAGETTSTNYQTPPGVQALGVTAESSVNVPFRIVMVDSSGLALQTADAVNGIATLSQPVTNTGVYVIKVVNLGVGPLQFRVTTTPTVQR